MQATTPQSGKAYLLNGKAIEIIQALPNGYLVADIYKYGEYEEDIVEGGHPYFVDKVYEVAPTEKLDEKILLLEQQISGLTTKKSELVKEVADSVREIEANKKLFKNYGKEAVKLFTNVLDGTITHFVLERYGNISIVERKELIRYESDFSINISMDITHNDFKCKMYRVEDRYSHDGAYPCKSHEEALSIVGKLFDDAWMEKISHKTKSMIASAVKLGFEVPESVILEIGESERALKLSQIENKRKELEKLEKELIEQ